jgi:hypothetical protein
MLHDMELHARLQGISVAEFVRRALTASMLVHADHEIYQQMRGQPSAGADGFCIKSSAPTIKVAK